MRPAMAVPARKTPAMTPSNARPGRPLLYQAPEFLTRRHGPFIVCRLRLALAMTGGTVGADVSEIRALGIIPAAAKPPQDARSRLRTPPGARGSRPPPLPWPG